MLRRTISSGFALPAVLITSIVMMIVLLSSLSAATSVSVSLDSLRNNRSAKDAAESGVAMARSCLSQGVIWTQPLRPGGDCTGLATQCTANNCYVLKSGNTRTSFEVSLPAIDGSKVSFSAKGVVELTRSSSPSSVWKSYQQTIKQSAETRLLSWRQPLTTGSNHTCALSSAKWVYCWGDNSSRQLGVVTTWGSSTYPVVPINRGAIPAGATIKELGAGRGLNYNCAIASDSQAYCWGNDAFGQLGNGATTGSAVTAVAQGAMPTLRVRQVSVGYQVTCAIGSDSWAYCWGYNGYYGLGNGTNTNADAPVRVSQGSIPAGSTMRQVVAMDTHSCAIGSNNVAYCWGSGANGKLGNGVTTTRTTPYPVSQGAMPAGVTVREMAVTTGATCAIGSNNRAYCWGEGVDGAVGNGLTTDTLSPAAVSQGAMPTDRLVKQISGGSDHVCAIASDNKAYCWGSNASGQLGNGSTGGNSSTPVAVSAGAMPANLTVRHISAGAAHTCAIASDDRTYCWGNGGSGRLGSGDATDSNVPVRAHSISETSTYPALDASVSPGSAHTCALGTDNWAYCWGSNSFASRQIGSGAGSGDYSTPVRVARGAVPTGVTFTKVSADGNHACAVGSDNWAYCWGSNANGQLGDNSTTTRSTPVAVQQGAIPAGVTIRDIETGWTRTCAIASDNRTYCWGSATAGRLGNGVTTSTNYTTPVAVSQGAMLADRMVRQISASDNNTCVIASTNNRAYCWGGGGFGANGNGSTADAATPVAVTLPSGVTSFYKISTGGSHACAIGNNNRIYCWGQATTGMLGNGSTTNTSAPATPVTLPSGVTSFYDVSVRGNHVCAIGNNNRAYCWGYNDSTGILGNGSTTAGVVTSPVAVTLPSGVTSFYSIESGSDHNCAVANNDRIYCWGDPGNGKLGNGSTSGVFATPVAISQAPNHLPTKFYSY